LAGINVRVTDAIALELSEGITALASRVNDHVLSLATVSSILSLSLIVSALVTNGQSDGHGEQTITLVLSSSIHLIGKLLPILGGSHGIHI